MTNENKPQLDVLSILAHAADDRDDEKDHDAASVLRAVARSYWAVRVLDALADHHQCSTPEVTRLLHKSTAGQFRIFPAWETAPIHGTTRGGVRQVAAKLAWRELPEAARAQIGEFP